VSYPPRVLRGLLPFLATMIAALAVAAPAHAQPIHTAVASPGVFGDESASADLAFQRVTESGSTFVRLLLVWSTVAPSDPQQAAANPADPANPAYRWSHFDRQVTSATRMGLIPIVSIYGAPSWAMQPVGGDARAPDPVQFGLFARAAAERYSGRHRGLSRVRYWQAWNEPNLHIFLTPQFVGRTPFSPRRYRAMVNEFARNVRSVHRNNAVIAGGTAPFRDLGVTHTNWGPLTFMREFFCLSRALRPTCSARVDFDIWAHHPYTSGGPTRKAVLPDDVSLGDLADMRRVLVAARRAGRVANGRMPGFWVTEFSWDTNPPDPYGVPVRLHTRWVAEALFRMWQNGVTLATWYLLRDQPFPESPFQGGLYHRGPTFERDRPKPALQAFRFPFVAFPQHAQKRVYVWGRTPHGRQARVLVEQQFQGGWRRLGIVQANRHGVFQARFATHRTGFVRARTVDRSERAVPFSLAHVPDRRFNPFGGRPLEP
jgi:hypothetical protein